MPINKGKHLVQEIDGVFCTVVDKGLSSGRMSFLKSLLEFNNFEVKTVEEPLVEGQPQTYILGVTDLVFNPVIAVYEKSLKRPDGENMTPAYWNQVEEVEQLPYFDYREKNPQAENTDDFLPNPWAYRTI